MEFTSQTESQAPRTSLLSLLALGLSIMCPLPLFGLAGAILGGVSLRRISISGGRLTGGVPAKAAVIIGVIVTAIQMYLFFGGMQAWTFYRKQMQPAMAQAFQSIELGDTNTSSPIFSAEIVAQLTQARLDAVRTALSEQIGVGVEVRVSFQVLVKSFRILVRAESVKPGSASGNAEWTAVPCTIRADGNELFAWVFFDADTLQPGNVLITDVLVQLGDGDALTLLPDGPAYELASSWLGWDVLELNEAAP